MPNRSAADVAVTDSLVQASFTVTALLSQVAAEHDLSLTQLRVLAILRDRQPKMAELAEYLGLERSTVSGLVNRAAARGLLRRGTSDDDGRAVTVSLTAEGRRLAALGTAQVAALVGPLTARLTRTEQDRLSALLGKLLG